MCRSVLSVRELYILIPLFIVKKKKQVDDGKAKEHSVKMNILFIFRKFKLNVQWQVMEIREGASKNNKVRTQVVSNCVKRHPEILIVIIAKILLFHYSHQIFF